MSKLKRDNDDIEEKANNLLNDILFDLFSEHQLKLIKSESGRREIGIDFFYQVFDRVNDRQILFFDIQNKGTDNPLKTIKQRNHSELGKISFPLELRHANQYYHEITEPILFILCDINARKAYWHPIQLDNTLPNRIIEKENSLKQNKKPPKRPKIQIYIPSENTLEVKNFERLIKDIEDSGISQIRKKYGTLIEYNTPNYSFIKEETNCKHVIDKLIYVIELFENFKTIPHNILLQLYPFKKNDNSTTYISGFTLHIDNEDIFHLLDSCILNNGEYELKNKAEFVENQSEKLNTIFQFFKTNLINHITWAGEGQRIKRVCVHQLYKINECDCERCSYERLDFLRTIKLLNTQDDNYSIYEKLRKAYAAYLIGNIEKATESFLEIYNCDKDNNPIAHITAKYNLIQLRKINSHQLKFNEEITKKLDAINYDWDELFVIKKAPHFLDIFKSIKDYNFFHNSLREVDEILFEIKKLSYNDKHGGWSSNSRYTEFKTLFLNIYSFLENNLLIFNYYSEYKTLTTKVLEGLFALHTLKNKHAEKYEVFESFMLDMWIFHVKYEDAQFLLKKYNIYKLHVRDNTLIIQKLIDYVDNLNSSSATIDSNDTTYFIFKVERILKNIILILSRIEIEQEELNQIFVKILDFSDKMEKPRFHMFGTLSNLLNYQQEVENKNVERLIHLMEKYHYKISNFSYLVRYYVNKSNGKEIEKFVFKLLNTNKFTQDLIRKENSRENYFRDLWYAYPYLKNSHKEQLNQILLEYLHESFDSDLFNWASLYEIIEYDEELFQKLIETIPDESKSDYHYFYPTRNKMLDKAINLSFKLNLPFDKLRKYSKYSISSYHNYYQWIMNLDGFDYSKFDPMWLTGYHSKHYIKAFRKSKKLISKVEESLKENYIEGVAKAYFNKLLGNK